MHVTAPTGPVPSFGPMSESTTALLVVGSLSILLCALSLVTSAKAAVAVLVLLGLAIGHEALSLGVMIADLWPHLFVGTTFCNCAALVLRREGDALVTAAAHSWWQPAVGLFGCVALIVGTQLNLGYGRMIEKAHLLGYLMGGSMCLSATIDALLRKRGASRATVAAFRLMRCVHDPATLFGIGVVFVGHTHDTQPVGHLWHKVMGMLCCLLGVTQCAVNAIVSQLPPDAPLLTRIRCFHAFMWMLNGMTWIHLAFFLNLFPEKRGVHHLLYAGAHEPAASDSVCVYLAFDVYLSAAWVAALTGWHACRPRDTAARIEWADDSTPGLKSAMGDASEESDARLPLVSASDPV